MLQQKTGMGSEPKWTQVTWGRGPFHEYDLNEKGKASGQDKIDRISDHV